MPKNVLANEKNPGNVLTNKQLNIHSSQQMLNTNSNIPCQTKQK